MFISHSGSFQSNVVSNLDKQNCGSSINKGNGRDAGQEHEPKPEEDVDFLIQDI